MQSEDCDLSVEKGLLNIREDESDRLFSINMTFQACAYTEFCEYKPHGVFSKHLFLDRQFLLVSTACMG